MALQVVSPGFFFVAVSGFFAGDKLIFSNVGGILGAVILVLLVRRVYSSSNFDATFRGIFRMNRATSVPGAGFTPPRAIAYARSAKRNR